MWSYLDTPSALLARELGAVPKFPPQHPRRVMLPVPKKLTLAAWGKPDKQKMTIRSYLRPKHLTWRHVVVPGHGA